jgi:hypothetical protein
VHFQPCGGQNLIGTSTRRPVLVTAGHVTRSVNARARIGGIIKGQVVSATSGRPQPGVCVFALDRAINAGGFVAANRHGDYVVNGLLAGSYRLTFSSCDGAHLLPVSTAAITVVIGRTAAAPTARIRTYVPGSISGRVASAIPSRGAPGVCVDIIPARGGNPGESQTGATAGIHGFYEAGGLVPGRYQVLFGDSFCDTDPGNLIPQWYNAKPTEASATVITVRAGRVTRPISAKLRPEGGISGTVTGSGGKPVTGICVRASSRGGDAASFVAVTSSGGGYQLGSLRPGRYLVEFLPGCGASGYNSQWWKNAASAPSATPVLVKSGLTRSGIDAALARPK